jgi:hypothetical protein
VKTHQSRPGPPRFAYLLAILCGLLGFMLVMALVLSFEAAQSRPAPLTLSVALALPVIFGYLWPGESWRWGGWVTSPFWIYFSFVFGSYVFNGRFEGGPVLLAIGVLIAGFIGSFGGSRVRLRAAGELHSRRSQRET